MPIGWNAVLNDLIILLASLYPEQEKARFVTRRTCLDPSEIDFSGSSKIFWMKIIEEANRRDIVKGIIDIARSDFPNINFNLLEQQMSQSMLPRAKQLKDEEWKGTLTSGKTVEKIIGAQSTFLPIAFLEIGLLKARSVVRVESPLGYGTGFLTSNNTIITNHHVISTIDDARKTKIWFNYQKTVTGTDAEVVEFRLDPDSLFATSPLDDGDDWTAVRVLGNPSADWGGLKLAEASIRANDFVNVVQHPCGLPKQIALYHNVIAYADDSRVQYMTDTMPGSSGSPVFDSDWNIVAVHHSGGWVTEPGTDNFYFRNEGVHVNALIKGLKDQRVL